MSEANGQVVIGDSVSSTGGKLKAPFPWFGGKSRAASLIWERFGNTRNYVEPFAGSLAVLLLRPHSPSIETVNDLDCYLANFWRAVSMDADTVAEWADSPVNEADLHARHLWLVNQQEFRERMRTDPEFYDPKIAGWWAWGLSCWIGAGWCAYNVEQTCQQRPHLGNTGMGDVRPSQRAGTLWQQIPHMSDAGLCVHSLKFTSGKDITVPNQIPHLGNAGKGQHRQSISDLTSYFLRLQERLRRVRVCCGDWKRVLGPSVTERHGITGVLLDPPYSGETGRNKELYSTEDLEVSHAVTEWAIANGDNPMLRIALCGYAGERDMPESWTAEKWAAGGGYDGQNRKRDNQRRKLETIWFNKACLRRQRSLFEVENV